LLRKTFDTNTVYAMQKIKIKQMLPKAH